MYRRHNQWNKTMMNDVSSLCIMPGHLMHFNTLLLSFHPFILTNRSVAEQCSKIVFVFCLVFLMISASWCLAIYAHPSIHLHLAFSVWGSQLFLLLNGKRLIDISKYPHHILTVLFYRVRIITVAIFSMFAVVV